MVIAESPATNASSPQDGGSQQRAILITGRGTDIAFNLDEHAPLEEVAVALDAQLAGQAKLFSEGGISVNTGNRTLSEEDKEEIRRIFREKSGLRIARFISADGSVTGEGVTEPVQAQVEPPEWTFASEEPPVRRTRRDANSLNDFSSADLARALSGLSPQGQRTRDQALVVRGTVRSGETVHHQGDLVVLGDVNPGSEVVAEGDIIVMGALKGLPHAGAAGDSKAAVIALEIAAPRIRIGNCGADSPNSQDRRAAGKRGQASASVQPTIAYVRRSTIYVSPFTGRLARYTKGVPYEG